MVTLRIRWKKRDKNQINENCVSSLLLLDTKGKIQLSYKYQAALLSKLGISLKGLRRKTKILLDDHLGDLQVSLLRTFCRRLTARVPVIKDNPVNFSPEVLFVLSAVCNGPTQTVLHHRRLGKTCESL